MTESKNTPAYRATRGVPATNVTICANYGVGGHKDDGLCRKYRRNSRLSDFVAAQVKHHLLIAFRDQAFQNMPEPGYGFLSRRNISG